MSAFNDCLAFTLAQEGGWSDNPDDPGGATMRGVTLASWRAWTGNPAATPEQLHAISDDDVAAFYGGGYWNSIRGDDLPLGVCLTVFDHGVNAGVRRSVAMLQACCGATPDGSVGPMTLAAARRADVRALIGALGRQQDMFYRSRPTFTEFGRGWLARLARRNAAALAMLDAPGGPATAVAAPVAEVTAETLMAAEMAALSTGA